MRRLILALGSTVLVLSTLAALFVLGVPGLAGGAQGAVRGAPRTTPQVPALLEEDVALAVPTTPSAITSDQAIATANRVVAHNTTSINSTPHASYWLATELDLRGKGYANALDNTPIWIVTYDDVTMKYREVIESESNSQTVVRTAPGQADVYIDAQTGRWLFSSVFPASAPRTPATLTQAGN